MNGASFNTQPDEESGLISSGAGVYYTILNLESPLTSSAQNALALTNLSSGNNIAVGWYENQDFTNSISLTDTSFNENKTLYLKIEVKFTITFDEGVDSVTKDDEVFQEIVFYIEPNGAVSNTYINNYLQGAGYNIDYKDYYKFKSWNLGNTELPSNGISVSQVGSYEITLITQRSSFSYQITNASSDFINVNTVVVDSDGTELGLPFAYGTLLKIGAVSNNAAYIVKAYMEKADNTLFELTRRDEAGFNYGIYFKETSETGDISNCAYIAGFGTRDNDGDYVIEILIEAIENTQQPAEKTFTVNYGTGISNITKGTESYASGSLQIAVALNTTITESYLNTYLSSNGYTVNYAESYEYDGWKVGDTVLTESGITVTESTSTALTLLAKAITVTPTYHTIVLPQSTNSESENYDANCGEEYEVLSTQTSAAVGGPSYTFKIKVLKSNIAKIEIYVNNGDTPENTVTNPSSDTEYTSTIPLAQTQTTYTITVKVYYNLKLNTNGATMSSQNATALGLSTDSYGYYITLEKGSNVSETLKTALSTNTYNGNTLFTKENCTFGGWYTSSDLSGSTYNFSNLTSLNSATSLYLKMVENTQQPTEKTFTVNYGTGISNITKGTESYASGSLQITVALNTTITESYLNSYLSDNGYTVNYAESYEYGGWKVGDTVLTEPGITVTESTSTALTLLADEIVVPAYHIIVLPQSTEDYSVLSTETSAAVGETSYAFKIEVLKSNIAKIEIYVNNGDTPANTVTNPYSGTEHTCTIPLAQTQTTYTITVKVYYNLELYINGATTGYAENLGLNNYQNSKFYKAYEKGSNIDNTLKTALRTNTYNGNLLFTKENCTFGGWYTDAEFNNQVNFDNLSIDSTTSLYLKMVENISQHNVTLTSLTNFKQQQTVAVNENETFSEALERMGITFSEGDGSIPASYETMFFTQSDSYYISFNIQSSITAPINIYWINGYPDMVVDNSWNITFNGWTNVNETSVYAIYLPEKFMAETYSGSGLFELKTLTFIYSITVASNAGFSASQVSELNIPDSVQNYYPTAGILNAFTNLEVLTMPFIGEDRTKSNILGYYFGGTNSSVPATLEKVTVTGGIIAQNCFADVDSLTDIVIGDSVTEIGSGAFSSVSLVNLTVPFIGKTSSITGNEGVVGYFFSTSSKIGYTFTSQNQISYYVPSSLRSIIVTKLQVISDSAFESMNMLTKILLFIDGTVTFGKGVFYGLSNSTDVYFINDSTMNFSTNIFTSCNANIYSTAYTGSPGVTITNLYSIEVSGGEYELTSEFDFIKFNGKLYAPQNTVFNITLTGEGDGGWSDNGRVLEGKIITLNNQSLTENKIYSFS